MPHLQCTCLAYLKTNKKFLKILFLVWGHLWPTLTNSHKTTRNYLLFSIWILCWRVNTFSFHVSTFYLPTCTSKIQIYGLLCSMFQNITSLIEIQFQKMIVQVYPWSNEKKAFRNLHKLSDEMKVKLLRIYNLQNSKFTI